MAGGPRDLSAAGYREGVSDPSFVVGTAAGVVSLQGDLDVDDVPALLDVLERCSDGHRNDLAVDLSQVTFLPSPVVGALARSLVSATRGGSSMELLAREGTIPHRVMQLCGMPFRSVDGATHGA